MKFFFSESSKNKFLQKKKSCQSLLQSKQGFRYFAEKKSKISREFQGQIRGKIGRFHGIFEGKKSKFAEQSA